MVTSLPNSTASRGSLVVSLGIVWVVWGSTYLAIRFAVETIPPFFMIGSRFAIAGLLMYAWLRLVRRAQRPTAAQWFHAAILGGLMLGVGTGLLAWAEQTVPSGLAALLVTVTPMQLVVLEWVWKGGLRPAPTVVAGLILGFIGVGILVDPFSATTTQTVDVKGVAAILVGTIAWATATLHGRDADQPRNPFVGTSMQMLAGGLLLIMVSVLTGEINRFDIATVSISSGAGWVYLVVIGSFIAYSAYVWLIRNATAASISTYAYVNPVVAVFLGWLLADERLDARAIIATGILVLSVALIMHDRNRRSRRLAGWRPFGRAHAPAPDETSVSDPVG
jgi:drug/metabolite transporter (DMT)-like permease